MLQARIDQDLKTALLARDTRRVSVLRLLKSAITYAEVAKGVKGERSLSDQEISEVLAREAKKRQESAGFYLQGGDMARSDEETAEKKIIDDYLPAEMSEEEIKKLVEVVISEMDAPTPQAMGQIIAKVRQAATGRTDGATVARLVKESLQP